jgi:uncharacterized protein YuzE
MKVIEKVSTKPKIHYDKKKDIIYIVTKPGEEEEFVEIADGVNLELDEKKEIIGIEIFNASKFFKPVFRKFPT